jgi:dienelactone hydrolase
MKYLSGVGLIFTLLLAVFAVPPKAIAEGTKIGFSSLDTSHPHKVSATLYMPENASSPVPAIVLIHGTDGIDVRGQFYRDPILSAGIAIFEVDFKTGIYRGPLDRPNPDTFLPMAFAALKELRKLPSIAPDRIGIMGFSMGGHIALRAAMESNLKQWMGDEKGFVAFATFYPVCKPFIKDLKESKTKLTGGPIIVFYGTKDAYGEAEAVPELKKLLATEYNFQLMTVEYAGATHGFNRHARTLIYPDPAAKGFIGRMTWDPEAANDSVPKVVDFLRENLAAK